MDIDGTAKKQRKHLRQLESNFNTKTKDVSPDNLISGDKLVELHNEMISLNEIGADVPVSDIEFDDNESLDEVDQHSLYDNIKIILSNKPWVLICSGITLLYYVVTGIQYWISDYMITTLKAD